MNAVRNRALLLMAALAAATGAYAAASDEDGARRLADVQERLKTLDARVSKLEAALQNPALVSLLSQVERLREEVNKLRGQSEVNSNALAGMDRRQKELYQDLDARLRQIARFAMAEPAPTQSAAAPAPAASPSPAPMPAPAPTAAAVTADAEAESSVYESALNLVRLGNYTGAITALQAFIKNHPASPLAPNAQYWIGYSYFASSEYQNAVAAQQKLLIAYPNSPKVPDAMLSMARAAIELKEMDGARQILEQIVSRYPLTTAADIAKKRLANMK